WRISRPPNQSDSSSGCATTSAARFTLLSEIGSRAMLPQFRVDEFAHDGGVETQPYGLQYRLERRVVAAHDVLRPDDMRPALGLQVYERPEVAADTARVRCVPLAGATTRQH